MREEEALAPLRARGGGPSAGTWRRRRSGDGGASLPAQASARSGSWAMTLRGRDECVDSACPVLVGCSTGLGSKPRLVLVPSGTSPPRTRATFTCFARFDNSSQDCHSPSHSVFCGRSFRGVLVAGMACEAVGDGCQRSSDDFRLADGRSDPGHDQPGVRLVVPMRVRSSAGGVGVEPCGSADAKPSPHTEPTLWGPTGLSVRLRMSYSAAD